MAKTKTYRTKQRDTKILSALPAPIIRIKRFSRNRKFALVLIVAGLLTLLYFNKSLVVAALVNGQPITAFELNQKINQLYRGRVLDQLINERIIEQEAAKKNIVVSDQQVDDKVETIAKAYGGKEAFQSLLAQQGLTQEEFLHQTRLQLTVENLFKDESTPSEDEIKKFMEQNANLPEATDSAKFRETAMSELRQQKLSRVFQQKFQGLKGQAKIQIF